MYSLQVLGPRSPRSRCGRTIRCLKALGGSFLPLPAPGRPSWASPGCGHIAPFASAVMRLLPVRLRPRLCPSLSHEDSGPLCPSGTSVSPMTSAKTLFPRKLHSQVEGLGQELFSGETQCSPQYRGRTTQTVLGQSPWAQLLRLRTAYPSVTRPGQVVPRKVTVRSCERCSRDPLAETM